MAAPTHPRTDDRFAYQRLADDLAAAIASGTLRPGDRLPSVRQMSAQRGVSMPTVLHAYNVLEARRAIAARPRSGYYVQQREQPAARSTPGPMHAPDPAAVTTGDLIMRVLEMVSDRTLVPLGTALPDPDLLPTAELARALGRASRAFARETGCLVAPSGALELRKQIARRAIAARDTITADDVVITCGAAEAIALALRALTQPGDAVAVESPAYFGTLQALAMLGLKAVEIPMDERTGMRLDVLGEALERGGIAAVVVTPNVHNPLGCIMPSSHKQELAALLARHGVPAIEDDTYGELAFGETRPPSLRSFDGHGLVLTCGSFSKTLAPGYRVGWIVPGRWRDRVVHLKLSTTSATSAPAQLALADFLARGGYDRHLRKLRRVFQENVARVSAEIRASFPAGTDVSTPAGGFLLWVRLPEHVDTVELQRHAVERRLSVAPGAAFSATGQYRNHLRVNAGYGWSTGMEEAVGVLARLIRRAAP